MSSPTRQVKHTRSSRKTASHKSSCPCLFSKVAIRQKLRVYLLIFSLVNILLHDFLYLSFPKSELLRQSVRSTHTVRQSAGKRCHGTASNHLLKTHLLNTCCQAVCRQTLPRHSIISLLKAHLLNTCCLVTADLFLDEQLFENL